jgi:hypothetical protein
MRVLLGLAACAAIAAGCERDTSGVPQIIPGPSVPSPVPLHAPYVWDTPEELKVWTDNAVSRGSFSIDETDSNGAIAMRFTGASDQSGGSLVLRSPDLVPPASPIRGVRIRYQWLQDSPSTVGLSVSATIEATNTSSVDQPRNYQTLQGGSGWKEIEFRPPGSPSLDVRYIYFAAYANAGVLKIDTITLVN